jgi:hypothetical protein
MDQVKQTELNEQFQLAQNKIVRESELMNLSQADIMNKLKQLQEDLKNQVAQSIITPLSKTNAPELVKQEEKYTPMTYNQYESIINKKPTFKVENRRGLIDELKEKLQKRKQTQMISEVFPEFNKRGVNKLLDSVLSDLINQGLKKQEVLKGAEKVVDNLLKQAANQSGINQGAEKVVDNLLKQSANRINITLPDILDKKSNLKSVQKTVKTKSKTPFQQELEAKLKNRSDTSTQATTASTTSSATSSKSFTKLHPAQASSKSFTKLHPAQATAQLRAEFAAKGIAWPYGKGNVSYANMINARAYLSTTK